MPTADELLTTALETIPEHTHLVVDKDSYFVIDPVTRMFECDSPLDNIVMQYDHNSERFTFELPRFVEGHDMMLCNRVRVHYNNVHTDGRRVNEDIYEVDDLRIDPKNPDNVLCSWLISRNATQFEGILSFLVQYLCIVDDVVVYEWHTDIYSDVLVKAGRSNTEQAVIEYTDVLEQWRTKLFGAADSAIVDIENATETQKAEIAAKGSETLASIPDDYSTTHNMADTALRKKADAIILSESGESIFLDDSSDNNLIGLNVYGKTTQIQTTGKNLINCAENFQFTQAVVLDVNIPSGTYIMSFEGNVTSGPNGLCVRFYDNDVWIILDNNKKAGSVVLNATETTIYMYSNGTTNNDGAGITASVKRLMISKDGGEYEPYSGGYASPSPNYQQELNSVESPTIDIYGKNLLLGSKLVKNGTAGGITCDYEGDGIFHIYGTYNHVADSIQLCTSYLRVPIDPNRKYTIHTKLLEGTVPYTYHPYVGLGSDTVAVKNWLPIFLNADTISVGETLTYSGVPRDTLSDATNISRFWIYHYNKEMLEYTADFRIQVWITEGEPCEYQHSDEKQTLSLTRTLHSVPVNQNGNYTDANGRQRLCDEVDFERGKFIQRIKEVDSSNNWAKGNSNNSGTGTIYSVYVKSWGTLLGALSTHFKERTKEAIAWESLEPGQFHVSIDYLIVCSEHDSLTAFTDFLSANNVEFLLGMDTPIETDLTAAELQAFKALATNATNTAIFNSQHADMNVEYVADLERYIYKNVTYKKRKFDLVLKEANWVASADSRYYTQVLDITARPNAVIDLHPTADQQVGLILDGIAMFIGNENGVVTAYCMSSTPGRDMTISAVETVVVYE